MPVGYQELVGELELVRNCEIFWMNNYSVKVSEFGKLKMRKNTVLLIPG